MDINVGNCEQEQQFIFLFFYSESIVSAYTPYSALIQLVSP
jgi:hypothetical protein